jgi:hypothetical protein
MSKIIIFTKYLLIWGYNGLASLFLHTTVVATLQNEPVTAITISILIGFFLLMVFLPEILWVSWKNFRDWIKTGIEDSDGKLNKEDLKDAGFLYVSLWSMRVFMGFSIAKIFGVEIDSISYLSSLIGSFGIAGLTILKNIKS